MQDNQFFPKVILGCLLFLLINLRIEGKELEAGFLIAGEGSLATIVVDSSEAKVVHTAVGLFVNDVQAVADKRLPVSHSLERSHKIIVGTAGVSSQFDLLCRDGLINIEKLKGSWERYIVKQVFLKSLNEEVLLVVGSTPRGTAYGLMELSELIGVSPWYWWADVTPDKKEKLVLPKGYSVSEAPEVRYRGIFINDEDWGIHPWAKNNFEKETGDIGPKTYEKVFELLLRLKANTIWPAMHACTRAFFHYPGNIKMADKYGIVVGSSHCEPMLRNNVDEWKRWLPEKGERGKWDYKKNAFQVNQYWKERVEQTSQYEGVYTIGMRGIHDGSMAGGNSKEEKVQLLESVFENQRALLSENLGCSADKVPQVFCPYKEVLALYNAGAKVPDDVTLLWADDNFGYIRQLSDFQERKRSGGGGVYYHLSYYGDPHDYLWLYTTPVSLVWEEMNKAYKTNSKDLWIANVGDIKPAEIGISFFLQMAWNPNQFTSETLTDFYDQFAEEAFGREFAKPIAEILGSHFTLGYARKPEHTGWNRTLWCASKFLNDPDYSSIHYGDELQTRIDQYQKLEDEIEELYNRIPENKKDAFYELVYYPVKCASLMNKKIFYSYKSRVYEQQQRSSCNDYAVKAKEAYEAIKAETDKYNNSIANGKWKHMMSYHPRNMLVFEMPKVGHYEPSPEGELGLVIEGTKEPINVESDRASFPTFSCLTSREYFLDLFNKGQEPIKWQVKASKPWIKLSQRRGKLEKETRIMVSVDWDRVPSKDSIMAQIWVKANKKRYEIEVPLFKPKEVKTVQKLFVEDNGVISLEAENFCRKKNGAGAQWREIDGLGRTGHSVGSFPVTVSPFVDDYKTNAPVLEYDIQSTKKGEYDIYFYCIPNQPISKDYKLRFAVAVDDGESVVVDASLKATMHEHHEDWQKRVLQGSVLVSSKVKISEPGKHVLKIWMIDPGVVLDKIVIDMGGLKPSYLGPLETVVREN